MKEHLSLGELRCFAPLQMHFAPFLLLFSVHSGCCVYNSVLLSSDYFLVGLILTETHHFPVLTLILSNVPITLPKNPQYFTSSDSDTSSLFADSNEF